MVFENKNDIAIITNNEKNPESFLVISELHNTNSDNIIKNLKSKATIVKIKKISHATIAMIDCIKIEYVEISNKNTHISYIFDQKNLRVLYVGPLDDYSMYENIINSMKILD